MQWSLVQKGQIHAVDVVNMGGQSTQWMQYAVDAVDAVEKWYMVVGTLSLVQKGQISGCSGYSEIVVYGCGENVLGVKRSNQWM